MTIFKENKFTMLNSLSSFLSPIKKCYYILKMECKNIKKILVIKLRHIGDVLLTVPALAAIREEFPQAHISVLVNSGTEETLTGCPFINDLIIFDRKTKGLPFIKKYLEELGFLLRIRQGGYDMTVDFTGGDRAAVISLLSRARYRIAKHSGKRSLWGKHLIATHQAHLDGHSHVVLQNRELLRTVSIDASPVAVTLHIPAETENKMRNRLSNYGVTEEDFLIHVHPSSRWFFKCWKDEYMAQVLSGLLKQGLKVAVTSAPDKKEIALVERILSLIPSEFRQNGINHPSLLPLQGATSIKEIAALSQACDLFFGVDSAPMHIAASVGTPVVALFGPSGAFNWGPWDNDVSLSTPYTQRKGIQHSGRHTVIQQERSCVPCGKDGCEGTKRSACLDDIRPDDVLPILLNKVAHSHKSIRQNKRGLP